MKRRLFIACTLTVFALTAAARVPAQDGATALRKNYQTILDNDAVEVVHVHYDAHEELPVHDHSHYPTIYVYLSSSGPVRFLHDEAHTFAITRRPVKAGWFRVSPGRIERHQVANLGPIATDFLRVECKHIPLGQIGLEFRFSRDVDLTKASVTTDYASPEMVIRRYVVMKGTVEHVDAESQPMLLIAVSSALVREAGVPDRRMDRGTVLWVKDSMPLEILPATPEPAHVLSIRLLR